MAEEIKCTLNDPKTGKSYSKALESSLLIGRKIGDSVPGNLLGLTGYELKISGGSDDAGFAMRPEIDTAHRKKLLVKNSIGVRVTRKGMYKRKTVRGNTVGENTAQINLSVTKFGTKALQDILGEEKPVEKNSKEESPAEKKE